MIRKLLSLLAVGSIAAAQSEPPAVKPDPAKIYPYVVPSGYFDAAGGNSRSVSWPLGHGLHIALVHDLGGLVRNVLPDELSALGMSAEEAKARAIRNLESLAMSGAIGQRRFDAGPEKRPFVLFGGHWAAATCILLPELRQMGVKTVGAEELCVCIPHREALLMFSKGDRAYRDAMRRMIRQKESDGRKMLSFELFELTPSGLTEQKD